MLNTFTLPVDPVAVGFLVGTLVHSPEAISALANVIGPGMCFLCGVFVPMDLLAENTALSSANRSSVFWSAGIHMAYALAIVAVTRFAAKKMRREA